MKDAFSRQAAAMLRLGYSVQLDAGKKVFRHERGKIEIRHKATAGSQAGHFRGRPWIAVNRITGATLCNAGDLMHAGPRPRNFATPDRAAQAALEAWGR
jgi:hypothetical protein